MDGALTRAQAADAVAARTAERDKIQENLLDLDASFGRRLLAGATLAGASRDRWETASAELAVVWDNFAAYAAVVDRACAILAGPRRPGAKQLDEITALLTGPSVVLARGQVPLSRRQLTDGGHEEFTLTVAVERMTAAFSRAAALIAAVESVWKEVSDRLDQAASILDRAGQESAGVADEAMAGALGSADSELRRLRDVLNRDPLSLWQDGRADTVAADRLLQQGQATAAGPANSPGCARTQTAASRARGGPWLSRRGTSRTRAPRGTRR